MMLNRAERIIAVADYSKFGVVALNDICPLDRIDVLVTDWSVPAKVISEYRSTGLHVIVAPPLK